MVRHSKAKEAMFPYPANTISGAFFWKEVAPKAPSGLGSEAMVDPCLHPRETTWGPVYLQSQSGRSRARRALLFPITLSRTSWKASCLSGSLPWLPVWPQSEIQVLSSFLCGDISVSTLQTTADDLLVRAGAVSISSATAVMSCHSSATERNAV